jgi:hypothetical protein
VAAARKKRPPGATTAAGYGYAHKVLSRRLRASMANGTPCARCGRPMYKWQKIHLDHVPGDKTRYLGLAHAHCNTSSGARYGNARRAPATKPWFSARNW